MTVFGFAISQNMLYRISYDSEAQLTGNLILKNYLNSTSQGPLVRSDTLYISIE